MVAQAFFYNAIFFTYALVLTDFYDIEFEPGRLVSPALRRRQLSWPPPARAPLRHRWPTSHDRHDLCTLRIVARPYWRPVCGWRFSATWLTVAWTIIFFFASAAASSAYLTVSETFPLEIRALAIAFFYAVGTGIGGVGAPWLFGALIDTNSRVSLFAGYLLGSVLMLAAAFIALRFGVDAERKPLEAVATPLSAAN